MSPSAEPLAVVVAGPTGSGKSALAMKLARELGGEIISCDSVAVYREFEIGTAKPSREDRAAVPHHMIDVASPEEEFTAGEYARQARPLMREIAARGKTPIIAGGTGLYLRALLDGLFSGPQRQPELRQRLREREETRGNAYLHALLARLDGAAAKKIHANDSPKIIRAIEICLSARTPMTELHGTGRDALTGFHILRLGLTPVRAALYARIDQRCQQMFDSGLVEETRGLVSRYAHLAGIPNSPMNSLGYRQAREHIEGKATLEGAIAAAKQGHRNYAKRQLTWFRHQEAIHWLEMFGDEPAALSAALALIK